MEQNNKSRKQPTNYLYEQMIFDKDAERKFSGQHLVFSTHDAGKIGYPCAKNKNKINDSCLT